jgi:hypothetical protein
MSDAHFGHSKDKTDTFGNRFWACFFGLHDMGSKAGVTLRRSGFMYYRAGDLQVLFKAALHHSTRLRDYVLQY